MPESAQEAWYNRAQAWARGSLTWRQGQGYGVDGVQQAGAGPKSGAGSLVPGPLLLQHAAGQGAAAALLLKHLIGAPHLVQASAGHLQGPLICTPAGATIKLFMALQASLAFKQLKTLDPCTKRADCAILSCYQ